MPAPLSPADEGRGQHGSRQRAQHRSRSKHVDPARDAREHDSRERERDSRKHEGRSERESRGRHDESEPEPKADRSDRAAERRERRRRSKHSRGGPDGRARHGADEHSSSSDSDVRLAASGARSRKQLADGVHGQHAVSAGCADAGPAAGVRVLHGRGSADLLEPELLLGRVATMRDETPVSPVAPLPRPPSRERPHVRGAARQSGRGNHGTAAAGSAAVGAAVRNARSATPDVAAARLGDRLHRASSHERVRDVLPPAPAKARQEPRPPAAEGRHPGMAASGVGGIRGSSEGGHGRPRCESPLGVSNHLPPPPPPTVLPGPPQLGPDEPVGQFVVRPARGVSEEAARAVFRGVGKGEHGDGMMGELMGEGALPAGGRPWRADDGNAGAFPHGADGVAAASDAWRQHAEDVVADGAAGADWAAPRDVSDGYLAAAEPPKEAVRMPVQLPGYTVADSAGLRAQMAVWKKSAKELLRYVPQPGGAVSAVFSRLAETLGGDSVKAVADGAQSRQMSAVQMHCGGAGLAGWLEVHRGQRRVGKEEEWEEEQWRAEVRESADAVFACSEALKREREAGWSVMGSDGAFIHGGKGAAIIFAGTSEGRG